VFFVSHASLNEDQGGKFKGYGLRKRGVGVEKCRTVKKSDIKLNSETPKVEVDPERYEVKADGVVLDIEAAETVTYKRLTFFDCYGINNRFFTIAFHIYTLLKTRGLEHQKYLTAPFKVSFLIPNHNCKSTYNKQLGFRSQS